jgi:cobalamin biosynthesis protein CobT
MALDAAGVSIDEVVRDAKARQAAIEGYQADQRKLFEAQWARKAEENLRIQAELETVKARYMERVRRNLDGVAREKATFGNWLTTKQQEAQSMAEAVELCLKETASGSMAEVSLIDASAKPV